MSSYDSQIGSKKFASSSMREIDVPDESGYSEPLDMEQINAMRKRSGGPPINEESIRDFQSRFESERDPADIEREIKQLREDKRSGKERLNEGAKRRISMLVGMTCGTREIDIDGNMFILQTLSSKAMREAIMDASKFDGAVDSAYEIRRQLLSRSITQVAGVEFSQFVGSNSLDAKLQCIDELHESLLNRLYNEYLLLIKENNEKYSIKDAADVKGLVEDLKK